MIHMKFIAILIFSMTLVSAQSREETKTTVKSNVMAVKLIVDGDGTEIIETSVRRLREAPVDHLSKLRGAMEVVKEDYPQLDLIACEELDKKYDLPASECTYKIKAVDAPEL
jgi:hypothetical protein